MSNQPVRNRKKLAIARESALSAKPLLQILFATLTREAGEEIHLPDIENVIDVYENPDDHGATVYPLRHGKAVLVEGTECDVLLSLSTARKLNEAGTNDFVEVLAKLLDSGEYSQVLTTAFSRLCRNTSAAGRLQQVLTDHRISVRVGQHELRVWNRLEQMLWLLFAWFAEYEAELIEARLLAGKVSRMEHGEWCFGFAPPPGWKLEDNQVVLDPETADAVRFVIGEVCAGETNLSAIARSVEKRWPNLEARRGGGSWNNAGNGTAIARSWLNERWFPAYTENEVELEFIPHATKRAMANGVEPAPGDIVRVRASLPPQPTPIATRVQVELVRSLLAERSEASVGRTMPGQIFGSGIGQPADEVEIVEVRL